jgi:hypothetical protein
VGNFTAAGACFGVAIALGYVEEVAPELLDELDQVRAIVATVTA